MKKALADHGIDYDEVIITVDENGKPSIPGSGLHFNLSHSDEKVLCAVSDRPVGCDVEKIEEIDIKIAKRFFTEEEYKIIAVSDDSQTEFYRIWTMKESFSKAIGLGLKLPLDSFTFENGRVLQDAAPETYYVKVSVTDDGYCRAVCSEYAEPCVITEYRIE
ncbi:MAG: 4'-phosphopantetheinyl transferase superfamily protein [Clostridia bacterium]|nr:4'-phosphopantetheinyl transferase superfamily protein [Clostridia bacterium]